MFCILKCVLKFEPICNLFRSKLKIEDIKEANKALQVSLSIFLKQEGMDICEFPVEGKALCTVVESQDIQRQKH